MISRICSVCGAKALNGKFCFRHRPRRPLKQTTGLNSKKPIKKLGRIGQKLAQQSKDYIANTKPPYFCIYCLHVGLEIPLDIEDVNVEHIQSKAKHPDLRFVKGNLAISCQAHNRDKSTLDIDQYLRILDIRMEEANDHNSRQV